MAPSDLSRALYAEKWSLATKLVSQNPWYASQWSKQPSLFDGKTPAQVLPLHQATVNGAPLSCIRALVHAYPSALRQVESSFQRLPLHCACRKQASADVIEYLVQKSKSACLQADSMNRLPLHYALTNGADESVVQTLMRSHPQAAKGCDVLGWTPVHIALSVGASPSLCQLLLEQHPESVLIRTNRGTSMRSVIPRKAPNRQELQSMVAETKQHVEQTVKLPALKQKSLRPSRMVLV